MLTFEEAERATLNAVEYLNSSASDSFLLFLRDKFDLEFQDGFNISINGVVRNHPKCSGCHGSSCTLGCFSSHNGMISYWDRALSTKEGGRLISHELGHVIHEQAFKPLEDERAQFERSEEFAQFVERHFNHQLHFEPLEERQGFEGLHNHSGGEQYPVSPINSFHTPNMQEASDGLFSSIISGIGLGLGFAVASVILKKIIGKDPSKS